VILARMVAHVVQRLSRDAVTTEDSQHVQQTAARRQQVVYIRGFQPVVRGPPVVRGELLRGPRATPEKLETRRILTKRGD